MRRGLGEESSTSPKIGYIASPSSRMDELMENFKFSIEVGAKVEPEGSKLSDWG